MSGSRRVPIDSVGQHVIFSFGWVPYVGASPNHGSTGTPEVRGQLFVVDVLESPWDAVLKMTRFGWQSVHILAEPLSSVLGHRMWRRRSRDDRRARQFFTDELRQLDLLRVRGFFDLLANCGAQSIVPAELQELARHLGLMEATADIEVRKIYHIREHLRSVGRLGADPLLLVCETYGREPRLHLDPDDWDHLHKHMLGANDQFAAAMSRFEPAFGGSHQDRNRFSFESDDVRGLGTLALLDATIDLAALVPDGPGSAAQRFDAGLEVQTRGLALASLELLDRTVGLQNQLDGKDAELHELASKLASLTAEYEALLLEVQGHRALGREFGDGGINVQ